ncbi:hypothetical protein RB595_010071 [Gaeumannomyces hyphopodioides]
MNPPQAPCVPQGLAPSPMLLHPSAAAATTTTTTTAAEVPKRRRISRPKVKSGCITCKKRHVKCDEMKPTCGRCAKAYVECLGYHQPTATGEDGRSSRRKRQRRPDAPVRILLPRPPPPPPPSLQPSAASSPSPSPSLYDSRRTSVGSNSTVYALSRAPSPSPSPSPSPLPPPPRLPSSPWPSSPSSSSSSSPSPSSHADDADAVYLDLFHSHLAHALAGPVPARFWSRTVPREAGRDRCVRSAVLAIAALAASKILHDDDRGSGHLGMTHGTVRDRHHQAAIAYYTEAVSAFRGRVGGGGAAACPPRSVLIATVLFVTYELLQGNDEAADGLVTSGMNLLGGSLGILGTSGNRGGTAGIVSATRAGGASPTPPVLLLPGEDAGGEGGGAGSCSQLFIDIYNENYELGGSSGLGYGDYFSSQDGKHDDGYDGNDNDDDYDDMHEIEHILPRLSVLGGMSAFFPRQQDERAVALLRTAPRSEFPPPQGCADMEQLASMWSDFSTRCLIWARRQACLGHDYVRGGASSSSSTLPAEEDPASLLATQGEFKALLSRWRAVLAERQAAEAVAAAEDLQLCPYTSSHSSGGSSDYPLLGLQPPWGSGGLSGSTLEQQSETMHALSVMELQAAFCDTFVTGCLDPTTLTYDALAGNFAEMVALARGVLHLRRQQQEPEEEEEEEEEQQQQRQDLASLGFTLDGGLVTPMAFVAAQCRDRALRMEAVELLCLGERREGTYDARAQAAGLLALVGLEEEGGHGGGGAAPPPLESRYIWSSARWDTEGGRLVVQFTRVVPDSLGNAVSREMALEL